MSKASNLPQALRRIVTWYASASGILLAIALTLSAAFFILTGLTDGNWPAWIGLGSTFFLGVFLPYRFARQQDLALTAIRDLAFRHDQMTLKFSEHLTQHAAQIQRLEDRAVAAEAALAEEQADPELAARLLRLEQRDENAELRMEKRVGHLEALTENPPVDVEALAASVADTQVSVSRVSSQLADVQAQVAAKNSPTMSS